MINVPILKFSKQFSFLFESCHGEFPKQFGFVIIVRGTELKMFSINK